MSKQYYIIYETKNLKNGKTYIGMHETDDLEDGYLGSGKRLKRAIRYYGKEFFERRVLHIFDNKEEMVHKEIELVTEDFVNRDDTYNLTTGGEGGFISEAIQFKRSSAGGKASSGFSGKKHSIESKQKNRRTHLSIDNPGFTGRKHSEETKRKMSSVDRTGHKNSQYGKSWITNGSENKKIFKGDTIPEGWKLGRKIK